LVLEKSIAAARQRGDSSTGLAEALNDLATLYHDAGRFADAEHAYKESLSIWSRHSGTHPKVGVTLGNLAGLRLVQGKLSEAEKLYLKAEPVLIAGFGSRSQELANALCGLADVHSEAGRYENARQTGERALAILEGVPETSQLGVALFLLTKVAWKQNRGVDAERLGRRAIDVWQRTLGPRHPTVASGLATLAVVLSKSKPDEASRLFRESLELIETELGPDHVFAGFILVDYAWHLKALGSKREANSAKRRGERILAAHASENGRGHTVDIKAFQRTIRE
jgi:tetratricopeptide (TPR) repeat protein